MTDHPRYSSPQQPGHPAPNQQGAPGYPQASQGGYQQPYDWRYATQQGQQHYRQAYDPYRAAGQGNPPTMTMPPVPRQKSRAGALTAGALAIAVVSAGIGGTVVLLAHPDHQRVTTATSAAPNGPANVPAANLPVGSVEQVAAKVVPSVVKLETELGRQSEEGSGIILSSDGLILTNNHVVAAAADKGNGPAAPPPVIPGLPGGPSGPTAPNVPGLPGGPGGARPAAQTTTVTFADGRTASIWEKWIEMSPRFSAFWNRWDPGAMNPDHGHKGDHSILVLKGSVACGDRVIRAGDHVMLEYGDTFGVWEAGPDGCELYGFIAGDGTPFNGDRAAFEPELAGGERLAPRHRQPQQIEAEAGIDRIGERVDPFAQQADEPRLNDLLDLKSDKSRF